MLFLQHGLKYNPKIPKHMNYLVVKNQGHLEVEDLTLIGSSTKRGDSTKIGQFGSGWKYALAWLMRNELTPKIFSGSTEIVITEEAVLHRNLPVKVITVNGIQTSLTTNMGPKWTGWMAVREIVSNAMDEGGSSVTTQWNPEGFAFNPNETTIYIPMNNELSQVMQAYDKYFSFERTDGIRTNNGKVFFKAEATETVIYRKGIRCYDTSSRSHFDFDFNEIEINESRLAQNWDVNDKMGRFMQEGDYDDTLFLLFVKYMDYNYLPNSLHEKEYERLAELIRTGQITVCSYNMKSMGGIFLSSEKDIAIPNTWYEAMEKRGLVKSLFATFQSYNAPDDFVKTSDPIGVQVEGLLKMLGINTRVTTGTWRSKSTYAFNDGPDIYVQSGNPEIHKYYSGTSGGYGIEQQTPEYVAASVLKLLTPEALKQIF